MTGSTGSAGYLKVGRWFTQIGADCRGLGVLGFWIWCLFRAAEVCSAEATELPVWKRPPVSVANGLCHPKALDPGSHGSRRYTRIKVAVCRGLIYWGFRICRLIFELHPCPYLVLLIRVNLCNLWMIILKDWITGQITPPNRCALWRGPRQPVMTQFYGLGWFALELSVHHSNFPLF